MTEARRLNGLTTVACQNLALRHPREALPRDSVLAVPWRRRRAVLWRCVQRLRAPAAARAASCFWRGPGPGLLKLKSESSAAVTARSTAARAGSCGPRRLGWTVAVFRRVWARSHWRAARGEAGCGPQGRVPEGGAGTPEAIRTEWIGASGNPPHALFPAPAPAARPRGRRPTRSRHGRRGLGLELRVEIARPGPRGPRLNLAA